MVVHSGKDMLTLGFGINKLTELFEVIQLTIFYVLYTVETGYCQHLGTDKMCWKLSEVDLIYKDT